MGTVVEEQLQTIQDNVDDAYTALSSKGATLPAVGSRGTANLASTIATVPSPDPANKAFDVVNGALSMPTVTFNENTFAGITSVGNNGLYYRFCWNTNATGSVVFQNVTSIGQQSLKSAFYNTSISSISFPSLTSIPDQSSGYEINYGAMHYMCAQCKYLESASFPELVTVGKQGLSNAFYYSSRSSSNALSVNFDKLTTVGENGFSYAFYNIKLKNNISFPKLETLGLYAFGNAFTSSFKYSGDINTVSFPSLTTVAAQSFSGCFGGCSWLTNISFPSLTTFGHKNAFINAFKDCKNLTEIHFRQDAQTSVESLDGYSTKWGATNATIYFDL